MVRAGVRREAGRDSRFRARHVVQGGKGRHVPRLLYSNCAARSTRSCRSSSKCCRPTITRSGSTTRRRKWPPATDDPNKTYTMDELKERGEKVYASNCAVCHQPTGKGAGAFPALDGSKIANGPHRRAREPGAEGQERDAVVGADAERRRNRVGHHLRTQLVGQPHRRHSPAEAGCGCP